MLKIRIINTSKRSFQVQALIECPDAVHSYNAWIIAITECVSVCISVTLKKLLVATLEIINIIILLHDAALGTYFNFSEKYVSS